MINKLKSRSKMRMFSKKYFGIFFSVAFFSLFLNSGFLLSGTKNGFIAFADDTIAISGKVLGPPIKPIVKGKSICSANNFFIKLNWPADQNSETFDIKRNGALLATNIIHSEYRDNDIATGTAYTYQVIARGPMGPGSATSDEIIVSTPDECPVSQPPFVQEITILENKSIGDYGNDPIIEERRPSFSGKTNIPNAKIEIILDGSPKIYQTIFANANGFWTWQSPEILDRGIHTLFVTAIDVYDPLISVADNFQFKILKIDTDDTIKGEGNNNNNNNNNSSSSSSSSSVKKINPAGIASSYIPGEATLLSNTSQNPPFQMTVEVENFNRIIFVGEDLSLHIDFSKKASFLEDKDYQIFYEVINANNKTVYVDSEYVNIFRNSELNKKITFSALASLGEYRIRVKAYDGKSLIAGENRFTVKDLPLFNVGFCTLSMAQIIQNFAWIIISVLLLFWFLLGRERHESEEGIYQMTEKYLKKSGFFSKKND
jgi:hypothetical protein